MKFNKLWIIVTIFLGGCASPAVVSWQKAWEHDLPFEQAAAKCEYETSAATQGVTPGFRTIVGVELDRINRKNSLFEKCMNAHGWVAARDYMPNRIF